MNNDDMILDCCRYFQTKCPRVILLSNGDLFLLDLEQVEVFVNSYDPLYTIVSFKIEIFALKRKFLALQRCLMN